MRKKYVLLTLTAFIAVIDIIFVLISSYFSHENFEAHLKTEAQQNFTTLDVALEQTYTDLMLVASLYAHNAKIQNLFYEGVKAVKAEGGGPGGAEAKKWRDKLFDEVGESWLKASKDFRIRQLHFHLGPGSTSYLRVHRKDKFGDNMDDVRFTIVETNATHQNQFGFETGRVYSGLRGVVPMFATDPQTGERVHTGALEAGTSFSKIIEILDDGLDASFTVLLTRDHIKETMWPEALERVFGTTRPDCRCVIEATSRDGVEELIRNIPFNPDGRPSFDAPYIVKMGSTTYAATFFPLYDFLHKKDPTRKNVGAVLVWEDITQDLAELDEQLWITILYAVTGFVILEIMLLIAFRAATRRLEDMVHERTQELSDLNQKLSHEVAVKNRFFSIIAHDLRSPFTTLLGMTRLIEEYVDTRDRTKLKSFAGHVNQAGEHFFELLQGLLEWSRHQMEKDDLEKTAFSLSGLVDDVIGALNSSAKEKAVTIDNTIDGVGAHADYHMISTVVRNLVANAIKFVDHGGRIVIAADEHPDHIEVRITDNGMGMDADIIPKLFRIDEKITTRGTEGELGTGLGLPLCKDMVDRHGGTIQAANNPDGGASFTFTLPKG
ncbi:ATP-binding protein [Magnetovibrio sp. PR-2]|uniref:ATP-binding protein n=1 Tax=Magnetovibrio sp. PR-2 TaxID=3120356 RepID=UPI002FCE1CF1